MRSRLNQKIMKSKIFLSLSLSLALLSSFGISAQSSTTAEQIAERIAQKMKDSLNLTSQQKTGVYNVNMYIANQKALARQQYVGSDSLTRFIQQAEGKRDSLYRTVIPDSLYQIYRQKKRTLISAN
jgi:ABC-type transporter MlaC component